MPKRKLIVVTIAALMTLGAASPALADCCDSFWDCAATVVTEGVSCAVQEFIDTVKGLVTFVADLMSEATGATGDATRSAQQFVTNTINQTTQETQSLDAELKQADDNGKKVASEEKQFKVLAQNTVAQVPLANVSPSLAPPTPPATRKPVASARVAPAQPASPSTGIRAVERNPNLVVAHPEAPSGAQLTATTVGQNGPAMKPVAAPARSYMPEMDRASAEISKARAVGDQDLSKVMQFMSIARQTEGTGMQSALTIADQAITAPFKNLLSQLTGMLTNPTDLTSPSSAVEAMANSIMGNLDKSVSQVINAITAGPEQAFGSAQPSYTDLQGRTGYAQAIANAMDVLYRERTPAALAALNALLPKSETPVGISEAARTNSRVVGHVAFNQVLTSFAASKERTKTVYMQRFQGLRQRMTQYEGVRAKVRTNRASMTTIRSNFSNKLNSYLTGRTPAEITAQRDSLIAEARKHFANDPKTRDAVITLLSSETAKRTTMIRH